MLLYHEFLWRLSYYQFYIKKTVRFCTLNTWKVWCYNYVLAFVVFLFVPAIIFAMLLSISFLYWLVFLPVIGIRLLPITTCHLLWIEWSFRFVQRQEAYHMMHQTYQWKRLSSVARRMISSVQSVATKLLDIILMRSLASRVRLFSEEMPQRVW